MADTSSSPKLLHSIPETVTILSLSRSSVYELIDAGELVRVKVGACALITAASVDAFVERLIAAAVNPPVVQVAASV